MHALRLVKTSYGVYARASKDERPMFSNLAPAYLPMPRDRQMVEGGGACVEAM